MGKKTVVNLGVQQFDKVIEEDKFYIDKTGFITEWWEAGADVTLITRPRRFGKTLNMSMVECFFSNQYAGRGNLFEGLSVWEEKTSEGEYRFRKHSLVNSLVQTGNPELKKMMEELLQGRSIQTEIDEQIVFNQLDGDVNAVWSLLLATGYLRVRKLEYVGERKQKIYTLALTNMEVEGMFDKMVRGWFKGDVKVYYNEFIKALLSDNIRKMNTFMNKVALNTFSSFDSGNKPSDQAEPERFYHGFVLGMVVNMADTHKIRSNRESGKNELCSFGRYDVMIEPLDRNGKAFIFEFKVLDPDEDEETLEDTLANAHAQIEEKRYEAELIAAGFAPGQIRKYGFAFQGKKCLIG